MAKILAQLILSGTQVVARAFARALREEFSNANRMSNKRPANVPPPIQNNEMALEEAMQILNVDKLDPELIEKNYKHMFEANDRKNGGSFYIQSKIYRAKERLDQETKPIRAQILQDPKV